jgi:hypothetical protein
VVVSQILSSRIPCVKYSLCCISDSLEKAWSLIGVVRFCMLRIAGFSQRGLKWGRNRGTCSAHLSPFGLLIFFLFLQTSDECEITHTFQSGLLSPLPFLNLLEATESIEECSQQRLVALQLLTSAPPSNFISIGWTGDNSKCYFQAVARNRISTGRIYFPRKERRSLPCHLTNSF